ncbi:MAG: reprolysin-like metallopeptidase, partial [Planctomycetota bacterium]
TTLAPAPGVAPSTPAQRTRLATLDLRVLQWAARAPEDQDSVRFNLFDDVALVADFERLEPAMHGGWVWSGSLAGDDGTVTVSVVDEVVAATIHHGTDLYQVDYAGNGIHWVRQAAPTGAPPCGTTEAHEVTSPQSHPGTGQGASAGPGVSIGQGGAIGQAIASAQSGVQRGTSGNTIDVLVVYSTAAKNVSGGTSGMQSKINLAVTETNDAYELSGVTHRLNLVHTEEMIGYTEPSSFSQMLSDLRSQTDGDMDEAHDLRDQYGADCVAMICQNGQYCGIAYLMTNVSHNFEDDAFSVTNYSCATGYYSFGHELGHNMGCAHDPPNAGAAAYSYSYGFRTSNNQYRTILAYSPGTRIKRFSSPSVVYNGWTMGDSNQDNARSLNTASDVIAGWRTHVPPVPTLLVGALWPGLTTNAVMSNCSDSGSVILAYSMAGNGPTNTLYGMADLSLPIGALPTVTADTDGEAIIALNPTSGLSGTTIWFQAVDVDTGQLTNGQEQTVL